MEWVCAEMIPSAPEAGETLWRKARTFAEMCELTAQYIEGTCGFFPGYGGPTDLETIVFHTATEECPIPTGLGHFFCLTSLT